MITMSPAPGYIIDPTVSELVLDLVLSTSRLIRVSFNRTPRRLVMSAAVLLAVPLDTAGEFIDDSDAHILTIGTGGRHAKSSPAIVRRPKSRANAEVSCSRV
jgi:hypothetical protein